MKKSYVALGVGAAALASVPVVAAAQDADPTTATPSADESATELREGRFRLGGFRSLTEVLGLTEEELETELRAGNTLADIATAQGVTVEAVVDALVADAEARISEAVADGALTQAEADMKLADLDAQITEMVNSVFQVRGEGHHGRHGFEGFGTLDSLTTVLGLTEEEIKAELQVGKTLADIAAEHNVAVDAVIDALVTDAQTRIATAVTDGTITQAEAEAKLADLDTRITDMVKSVFDGKGHEGRHGLGGFGDLASIIGIDSTTLTEALQAGSTPGEIAEGNGVTINELRTAMLSNVLTHLDEEVAEGDFTQAEADAMLATAESQVDDVINGVLPALSEGRDGFRGRHGFGPDGDDDAAEVSLAS